MRVGFITRWRATCGIAMHAELLVPELRRLGCEVKIFAPTLESANRWWHHRSLGEDEEFVVRCYSEVPPEGGAGSIDEEAVLQEDFDVLVVESYASLPYAPLQRLLERLKAKKVCVVHEGAKEVIGYSLDIFDAVVVFDERYYEVVDGLCPRDKVHVIPYPCHPVVRRGARRREERIVFFSFGRQPEEEYADYLRALKDLRRRYDLIYTIVRSDRRIRASYSWVEQRVERLSTQRVYEYLQNADFHLIPKGNTTLVVVSSTLFQTLGALTPTVAPNTRHFEALPEINGAKPAVIYSSLEDLKAKLIKIIEDEEFRSRVIKAAEEYVRENSSEVVAEKFLSLFRSL